MRRISIFGMAMVLTCVTAASAEQEVTLQSGAKLVGDVSMEGDNLVVDVDGAKLQVPFKDVAKVAAASAEESNDVQQLLLKAIESQVLADDEKHEVGLFAEAFRSAPEDPQVAFWYARSLVNSGFGKGAGEVFEPRREAIVAAYPGLADRLAKQIEERMTLERLPAPLVKRIDQIAAAAKQPLPIAADSTTYVAYFQIVDQSGEPIERADFGIETHGQEGELESFDDGYHLYTYERNNHFHNNPCRVEVARPGMVSKSFSFEGGARGAKNAGTFQVTRLSEEDRRPVVFRVVDAAGKPLSGATVSVNSSGQYTTSQQLSPLQTNADGLAKTTLYPNQYYCQVSRDNYNPISKPIAVPLEGEGPIETEVGLYPAIQATIQVEWQGKAMMHPGMPGAPSNSKSTGKFEQSIGANGTTGAVAGRFGPPWVQLVQTENELKIKFMDRMHFPNPEPAWVGRLAPESSESNDQKLAAEVNAELFDVLALDELESLAQEFKIERTNLGGMGRPGGDISLPIEAGDIYLGRLNGQDPETGRPATIEFKLLLTDVVMPGVD